MDRASQALAEGLELGERRTYTALLKKGKIARTTLFYRDHGRPLKEDKTKKQQYLTLTGEKALVLYLIRLSDIGFPVPIKYIPSLAFIIARQRSVINQEDKPPSIILEIIEV
jgi:hypothetical protein